MYTTDLKRREVIGNVSANCYLLKHNTKVSLREQALWGALAGREHARRPRYGGSLWSLPIYSQNVIGYHPPLTNSEIKFIVASEI